jgi:hypothetical protein
MLAELVEEITLALNTSSSTVWGTLKVPDYVTAEECLDPEYLIQAKTKKLFVMPLYTGFSSDTTLKRNKVQSVGSSLIVSVSLLIPFQEFSTKDVTNWAETKKILELREKIDLFVIKKFQSNLGFQFSSADPQPPVEIELNQRNFLSSTEFTFEGQVC